MTAGFACELSTKNEFHSVNEANHLFRSDTFWLVTTGFSVFLYFCIVCMAIPLAICINYIQLPSDQHWRQQLQDTWARAQRHGHGKNSRQRRHYSTTQNRNPLHSYRSDEAQSLITSRNNLDDRQNETTTTDPSTDIDTYYNMLIKRKNEIKSISTFAKQQSLLGGGGLRRHFKRRQRQSPVGATITDNLLSFGKYNKPQQIAEKQKQQQQMGNDSLHQFSSAGEDYYQLMLQHQKVRSVSQYKAMANK